jgi:anti-anti-sigma factor
MTASYFRIDEHPHAEHTRLSLVGELDLLSASLFEDRLDELASQKRDVRLDLSELDFIDSTGIRVLLRALFRSTEDGCRSRSSRTSPTRSSESSTSSTSTVISLSSTWSLGGDRCRDESLVDRGVALSHRPVHP